MIISHNILAMNAEINLKKNTNQKAKSSEKLSSGYRINRSSDDAAGLAISEKMRSQIRGLKRASNNVQDGISYIRVADGALNEVSNMLQRMRELAVQSANGVYSDDDRQKIQTEVDQIKNEIDRVFTTTEFNTKKIWDPDNVIGEPVLIGHHTESVVNFHSNTVVTNITNSNKAAIPKTNFNLNANTSGITVSWDAYNGNHYTSSTVPWPSTGITSSNNFNL
ncbi:MAG: hypothetical protein K6G63_00035, partial [Eubacterium sp.]|nr:hypothetical protein [Eubacterium sp.]